MGFDPDAYLGGGSPGFDPDKYLGEFNPDAYLAEQPAGVSTTAKTTGYHPVSPDSPDYKMEGGNMDKMGKPIFTLDQYRRGEAPFVTIAGDPAIPYGTPATSPHFPGVPFMVNDTGSAFKGAGLSHFDIARDTAAGANSDENNRQVQFDLANPNFALPQQQDQPQAALPQESEAAQPDITAQQILGEAPTIPGFLPRSGTQTDVAAPVSNLNSADSTLNLSPQEKFLYQYHLNNLHGSGKVINSDGSVSTIRQTTVELNGKTYNLPTIWDGAHHSGKEAIEHAKTIGLDNFPAYASDEEAQARYDQMHKFMDRDVGQLLASEKPQATPVAPPPPQPTFLPRSGTQTDVEEARQYAADPLEIPYVPKQEGTAGQIAAGLANVPIGFANFLVSPAGPATLALGGMGPTVARAAAAVLAAQQAAQGTDSKDLQDKITAYVGAGLAAAGAIKGARGAHTTDDVTATIRGGEKVNEQGRIEVPNQGTGGSPESAQGSAREAGQGLAGGESYQGPQSSRSSSNREAQQGSRGSTPPDRRSANYPSGAEPATGLPADRGSATPANQLASGQSALTPQGPLTFQPFVGLPPVEPSPEFGFTEKVKRVASETGANKPQSVNFRGGADFRRYFQEWGDRLKGLVKFARTVKRYTDTRQVRDTIAATYDAIDNKAGYVAKQAGSNVRLNLPSKSELADKAATFVRQAEGDRAGMTNKLQAIRGRGFDDVIDYALRNWEKLEAAADAAKKQTDTVYDAELAAGIDFGYRQGYVKGVYEDDLKIDLKPLDAPATGGGGTTAHTKSKVFNDYAEAIAAGYKPRDLRLSVLTESSVRNGMRLVNNQAWAESLGTMVLPDGKPAMVPMETVEARDSAGNIKQRQSTPEGYTPVQVNPGNLVAVHEDAAGVVHALSAPSQFPQVLSKASASVKHNMLAFDIYHGSRFGQMQMAFEGLLKPSYHKGLAVLEFSDSDLGKAVKAGEISQREADWATAKRPIVEAGIKAGLNSGRISDALFRQTAPLFPYAKATSEFIFGKLSRGVISQSYVYAFERNGKIHPEWSSEKLHVYTAREVNTYYRNMGSQGLFKSKTWQDGARFLTFAPQWFEGKARSEGRGYGQTAKALINPTKGGNVAKGMGTGLVAYFAVNQMVNMLTRGQPTWDNPEHGHKFDAWIPDFTGGSNGFFHSPLGVFAELSHDAIKAHERGTEAMNIPLEIGKSQLGIAYAVTRDLFGGVDFYGRPLEGFDRFKQAGIDAAPVPITIKNRGYAGAGERNLFSFAGLKITPAGTKSSNIYQMANDFMRKNDIKVERGASVYSPLRQALAEGRMDDAKTAYQDLLKQGPTWESIAKKKLKIHEAMVPDKFTNSNETESRFRKQLTRDQLDIYNAALAEKRKIWQQYQALPKN